MQIERRLPRVIQSVLISLVVTAMLMACACSSTPTSSVSTQPKPVEPEPKPEQEYSFVIQGGKTINASVFDASQKYGKGKKLIIFQPFVYKTDSNFYLVAFGALRNIYGKKRGLFQLENAQMEYVSDMGGKAIYWYISNPRQRFYSLPIKDSETGEIGAMVVWVSDLTSSDKIVIQQRATATKTESPKNSDLDKEIEKTNLTDPLKPENPIIVTTEKGTPKMVEMEDGKNKKQRY